MPFQSRVSFLIQSQTRIRKAVSQTGLRVVVEVDNLIYGRFTSDLLTYESAIGHKIELPLTMVKGFSEPLQIYNVLRLLAEPPPVASGSTEPPLL